MPGRNTAASDLILPAIPGLPANARRLDQAIAYLLAYTSPVNHAHSIYQPWGVVDLVASDYVVPDVAGASAVNILLDANLAGFDIDGLIVGKDHQVVVSVRQDGTGGRTFDFANTWDWYTAGSLDAAAEPLMPTAPDASLVAVLASTDGGVLDRRAYYLGLVQTIGPFASWPQSSNITTTAITASAKWRARRAGRWVRMSGTLDTPTVGASFKADLLKSTDDGATWVTVFTDQAHQLTVAAAARTASTTTFDIATFDVDDLFGVVYDQVGVGTPGKGVNIFLDYLET